MVAVEADQAPSPTVLWVGRIYMLVCAGFSFLFNILPHDAASAYANPGGPRYMQTAGVGELGREPAERCVPDENRQ